MIKIDFEFETKYGVFRDALHLPDDHSFSDSEIQQMKQQRLDNWISVIEAPPAENINEVTNNDNIEISGELYTRLVGVPPSGAKLVEINKVWYYKE